MSKKIFLFTNGRQKFDPQRIKRKIFLNVVNVLFHWSVWLLHYSYKMRMIILDFKYAAPYEKAFGISMLLQILLPKPRIFFVFSLP